MSRVCIDRKPGERIEIGPDIWIDVVRVRGQRVRLCVNAPREVEIHRIEPIDLRAYFPDEPREAS